MVRALLESEAVSVTDEREQRIKSVMSVVPQLTDGQLLWLEDAIRVFSNPCTCTVHSSDLLDDVAARGFGDALQIHHSFSAEPLSKDRFEYLLLKVLPLSHHTVSSAPRGNPGHDITIDGCKVSLKTQANREIRSDVIWISKFMELGKGRWTDNPGDLVGLRALFLAHLKQYARILSLRCLTRAPQWRYELVEIPKSLVKMAIHGELEMKLESRQYPKPGYCYVRNKKGEELYQLYFDGGTERKLQIKNLKKHHCTLHAAWEFVTHPV